MGEKLLPRVWLKLEAFEPGWGAGGLVARTKRFACDCVLMGFQLPGGLRIPLPHASAVPAKAHLLMPSAAPTPAPPPG